jgi:manganese/zinc/iron transport system substrate-binding protein
MQFKIKIILLLALSVLISLSSCKKDKDSNSGKGKLKIVCTTGMIRDIVKQIAGNNADVYGLMGPGVDPHLYKATPNDVNALFEADIIFYNGLHLEAKMAELFFKMSKTRTTVAVTEDIPENDLLSPPAFSGMHDPHVWFDVLLWEYAVKRVERTLSSKLPAKKKEFAHNTKLYLNKLQALHRFILKRVEEVPPNQRILITAHDAFGYFGKRYGFSVVGLQGISTQSEAGTGDVQNLVNLIVSHKIRAIFIESSVPVRNIKAVQEAVEYKGWHVSVGGELYSDAMGDKGTFEGTYIGMLTHNINTIVDALTGKDNGK